MSEPRRPGQYPPPVQRWRFAEPPVKRRWFWVAVVAGPLAVAAMLTGFIGLVVLESRDAPGLIDDNESLEVVARECELMTSTVEGLDLAGPPTERAATLRAQNTAVERMVGSIRDLDDEVLERDRPLLDWLDDWDRLLQAREEYAVATARGDDATLAVPLDDSGERITDRMDGAGLLVDCQVPEGLFIPQFADSRTV